MEKQLFTATLLTRSAADVSAIIVQRGQLLLAEVLEPGVGFQDLCC